jgi:hypothetical protein
VRDDLDPLFASVHTRREVAVVAGEVGFISKERNELAVTLHRDRDDRVAEPFLEPEDVVPELSAQARLDLRRWERA